MSRAFRIRALTLPVLFRELAQLASRRSTYAVRTAAAILLYLLGGSIFGAFMRNVQHSGAIAMQSMLGSGQYVLYSLHSLVSVGLCLLLPAMVVSTVTSERENGTLELMLVTRLHPWQIVLQKLFARLVPVGSLLVLTVPFLALAYTLGGVSVGGIALSLVAWLLMSMQLAALALMCSSIARQTVGAFFLTYAILFGLLIGMSFLGAAGSPYLFIHFFVFLFGPMRAGGSPFTIFSVIATNLIVTLAYLVVARYRLPRPQKRHPRSLKSTFRNLDRFFDRTRIGRRKQKRRTRNTGLPVHAPVAWRERAAIGVGSAGHMFRLSLLSLAPTTAILLIIYGANIHGSSREHAGFSIFLAILWIIVALVMVIYIANLISRERVDQTLDVLMVTPLSGADIVRQKLGALPRLRLLLAVPLVLTIVVETLSEMHAPRSDPGEVFLYTCMALGFTTIYLYALTWITYGMVIKPRKRAHVVAGAIGRVFAVIFLPLIIAAVVGAWGNSDASQFFAMMSPMVMLGMLEFAKSECFREFGYMLTNACCYLGVAVWLHVRTMSRAEHLLRAS